MRRRNFLAIGAGAAGVVAMPPIAAAAATTTASGTGRSAAALRDLQSGTLRQLAERIGLHIGTAVIPFDLDTPAYTAVLASQFSVVTPGNEMKWGVVEPQQGVFDWSGADRLVKFAKQNEQLVRGHTLL